MPMGITKSAIRKLEKKVNNSFGLEELILPIYVPKEKAEQLMREAKKQGRRLGRCIPLTFSSQQEVIKLWESV